MFAPKPNREPRKVRDILETACPFSMMNPEGPLFCRADCQAFKGGDERTKDLCVLIESLNQMSMNIREIKRYATGGKR